MRDRLAYWTTHAPICVRLILAPFAALTVVCAFWKDNRS